MSNNMPSSLLPITAAVTGGLGFFASTSLGLGIGAGIGLTLGGTMLACGLGGFLLWPLAYYLGKYTNDEILVDVMFFGSSAALGSVLTLSSAAMVPVALAVALGVCVVIALGIALALLLSDTCDEQPTIAAARR